MVMIPMPSTGNEPAAVRHTSRSNSSVVRSFVPAGLPVSGVLNPSLM